MVVRRPPVRLAEQAVMRRASQAVRVVRTGWQEALVRCRHKHWYTSLHILQAYRDSRLAVAAVGSARMVDSGCLRVSTRGTYRAAPEGFLVVAAVVAARLTGGLEALADRTARSGLMRLAMARAAAAVLAMRQAAMVRQAFS